MLSREPKPKLSVLGGVWSGSPWAAIFGPFVAFLLGGVAESFVPRVSAAQTAKRVVKVLGAGLLGIVGWFVLAIIAG